MKYIKLFEYYQDIDAICDKYNIRRYTVDKNGLVDVNENVNIKKIKIPKFEIKFGRIEGEFSASDLGLETLEGAPYYVGGSVYLSYNKLTSLEGCPKYIDKSLVCNSNNILNMQHSPTYANAINVDDNINLNSLKYITKDIPGYLSIENTAISNLLDFPNIEKDTDLYIKNTRLPREITNNKEYIYDILKLQDEYQIWYKDGSLNKVRFNLMRQELYKK